MYRRGRLEAVGALGFGFFYADRRKPGSPTAAIHNILPNYLTYSVNLTFVFRR
jgi:hypothetical protein